MSWLETSECHFFKEVRKLKRRKKIYKGLCSFFFLCFLGIYASASNQHTDWPDSCLNAFDVSISAETYNQAIQEGNVTQIIEKNSMPTILYGTMRDEYHLGFEEVDISALPETATEGTFAVTMYLFAADKTKDYIAISVSIEPPKEIKTQEPSIPNSEPGEIIETMPQEEMPKSETSVIPKEVLNEPEPIEEPPAVSKETKSKKSPIRPKKYKEIPVTHKVETQAHWYDVIPDEIIPVAASVNIIFFLWFALAIFPQFYVVRWYKAKKKTYSKN